MFFGGGFPGGGGMGGMGRGGPVDNDTMYKVLGLDKNCSQEDVKKAYRKMAIKHHPDKGGDEDTFKNITKAYEILSDEQKRKMYDEGGEEAVENGGGGMHDAHDIFSAFFGGGGRRQTGPKKGQDLVHPIALTLENLYSGKTVKLALTRKVICKECEGSGSKNKGVNTTCDGCNGQGIKIVTRQIAPGMIQQMQQRCPTCEGTGTVIKESDKCTACTGKKVGQEKKVLEVQFDKGMSHAQKVVFSGEADEAPGTVPGDVVFVVQQKEHEVFLRKGDDLLMTQVIQLVEALCGTEFIIPHLDGRKLKVRTNPGEIIKPGDVKTINDEGMPMHKNPFVKGKLYIKFDVKFPENGHVTATQIELLTKALPAAEKLDPHEESEEVFMHDADLANLGASSQGGRGGIHDEDDDEGGQPMGCQQQ